MHIRHIYRLFLIAVLLPFPLIGHGLSYTLTNDGDVVTLTGLLDGWRDRESLWQAIRGKRVLILNKANGESVDSALMLGEIVRRAKITTVVDGDCDVSCMPLFIGGAVRQWGFRTGTAPAVLTMGNRNFTSGAGPGISNPVIFHFYSGQLPNIPFSVMNTYLNSRKNTDGLRFVQPSEGHPDGEAMECASLKDIDRCVQRNDLLPLAMGIVTTAEPYLLPVSTPQAAQASAANQSEPGTPIQAGTVLLARAVNSTDGPTGIASSFNLERRIFVYASFSWTTEGGSGMHEFLTRWYRGDALLHTSPAQRVSWRATPAAAWYAVRAADFGVGNYKVEIWMDGKRVGDKSFTIRAE